MDDERPRGRDYGPSPARMSKTPSWIMLGFVLGALFMAALPPLRKKKEPVVDAPRRLEFVKPSGPRQPQPLTTVEAIFADWARYAVWSDDVTEIAAWNAERREFDDYFEVRRVANAYYFRSIPTLTRRVLNYVNLPPECPLRFTESEEEYRTRAESGRVEQRFFDLRPASRNASPPPRVPTPAVTPADPGINLTPDVKK